MNPKGHLLLDKILREIEPTGQFLRADTHALVLNSRLVKAADHHGVDGHTLEIIIPVGEARRQIDMT